MNRTYEEFLREAMIPFMFFFWLDCDSFEDLLSEEFGEWDGKEGRLVVYFVICFFYRAYGYGFMNIHANRKRSHVYTRLLI